MVQRQARHICDCSLRFGVDSVAAMLQKGFLKKFLDRSVSFLRQETHEHVETIKKRCLEAENEISLKMYFNIDMFSRRVSLPGLRRPKERCFV